MCFTATASFGAALVLITAGVYCLKLANEVDGSCWALAMLPLMFGLQQALEGGVWLALLAGDSSSARLLSLGFLMFSHVFWLGWIGFSSYLTETSTSLSVRPGSSTVSSQPRSDSVKSERKVNPPRCGV